MVDFHDHAPISLSNITLSVSLAPDLEDKVLRGNESQANQPILVQVGGIISQASQNLKECKCSCFNGINLSC